MPRKTWVYLLIALLVGLGVLAMGERRHLSGWSTVCALVFSRDGKTLVAGLYDGSAYNEDFHYLIAGLGQTVALYDSRTGKEEGHLVQLRHPGPYSGIPSTPPGQFLDFSPNGRTLAVLGWDGTVQLWDWQTKQWQQTLRSNLGRSKAVAFSGRGGHLIAGGRHGMWTMWDVPAKGEGVSIETSCPADVMASARDSARIAFAGRHCDGVELFDCDSRLKTRIDAVLANGARAVRFSPDGQSLAIGGIESTLLWDIDEDARRLEVSSHWTQDIAFSPNGKVLTLAGPAGLTTWSADTGEPIPGIAYERPARSLAYSTDGTLLAVGRDHGWVDVWEVTTNHLLWSAHVKGASRGPGPFTAAAGSVFVLLVLLAFRHAAKSERPAAEGEGPFPVSHSNNK